MFKTSARVSIVVFVVGLFMGSGVMAHETKGAWFTASFSGKLVQGKSGTLTLRIVPKKGYKWNEKFPAKLQLTQGKHVKFSKTTFKQQKGEFGKGGKDGLVKIVATGTSAGADTVHATLNLSICKADLCRVFRKQKLHLKVMVK
jgi:predicted secreted protein